MAHPENELFSEIGSDAALDWKTIFAMLDEAGFENEFLAGRDQGVAEILDCFQDLAE